jgi:N-formylglutamate amidohydrolase
MIHNDAPIDINHPIGESSVVISLPHSGRFYPPDMVAASRLCAHDLRASEDALVDELLGFEGLEVAAIRLNVARAFCDVNRHALELDERLIDGALPRGSFAKSARVRSGFGVVARCVTDGVEIYQGRLSMTEVAARLAQIHAPYHQKLAQLLAETREKVGKCLLLDCHSMPATVAKTHAGRAIDVVLSNQNGVASTGATLTRMADYFTSNGLKVARNDPFLGGYILQRHADPKAGIEGVQVEINRALYVNEKTYEPTTGFAAMAAVLRTLITRARTWL